MIVPRRPSNQKTSTQISVTFTLYVTSILVLVGVAINGLFFVSRYRGESQRMMKDPQRQEQWRAKLPRQALRAMVPWALFIPDWSGWRSMLDDSVHKFGRLVKIDEEYLLITSVPQWVKVLVVTHVVEMQRQLFWITLAIIAIVAGMTYLFSHRFVKKALSRVHTLLDHLQNVDIHTLWNTVPRVWPDDDEIQRIAHTLQTSFDLLHTQTEWLKHFVSNASHELKTPLMALNSTLDVGTATQDRSRLVRDGKQHIKHLNALFSALLSLIHRESSDIATSPIDVVPMLQQSVDAIAPLYREKEITLLQKLPEYDTITTHPEVFRMIVDNLITNAYKYTDTHGSIHLSLTDTTLVVSNTGEAFAPDVQQHMWERFWKDHSKSAHKEWFGLGLHLVSILVQRLGWEIAYARDEAHSLHVFTIHMQ
jgi:signal transduction histidine kinase